MRYTLPSAPDMARVGHGISWTREARAEFGAAAMAFRTGMRASFAAWPALLGRVVFFGVCLMVLGAFWTKVGVARLPGTLATRLPAGGLTPYVGVTEWITISTVAVHLRIEDEVRSGALEARLLRPRFWIVLITAEALGGMAARMTAIGAAALPLLALAGRGPGPAGLAQVATLGVFGGVIGVQLYVVVGLCAFWLRRVLPAMLVMQKLMFLLGGLFAPISLYDGWLRTLALASPFAANLGFAGEAMLAPSWTSFARALTAQCLWAAALAALIAIFARAGVGKALREGAA